MLKIYLPSLPCLLGSIHDFTADGTEEAGRERGRGLRGEVGPLVNGVACWESNAVGVMACEVTLNIGTVGSPSFFVKEAFAVEVWVSGLPVINHLSPFFSLTAQYKA